MLPLMQNIEASSRDTTVGVLESHPSDGVLGLCFPSYVSTVALDYFYDQKKKLI